MALFICFSCESPCMLFVVEGEKDDFRVPSICPWDMDNFKWKKFVEVDE